MSRSGYSDDCEYLALYRGAVVSAIRGQRGQLLLSDLAEALDAMPVKELIANALEDNDAHCALGVVGLKRGIVMKVIDPEDAEVVAKTFNVASALAREVMSINDDDFSYRDRAETSAERWARVRKWVNEVMANPSKAA